MASEPPVHPEKPVGFHDKPMSFWQRIPVRSDTGGVSPMFLEGRERFMTERMRGMTPERRAWRKQWLHDQVLSHREPVNIPQIYTELNNPIRRFLNYPFRQLELYLYPKYGFLPTYLMRYGLQISMWCIPFIYIFTYAALHWGHDWTHLNNGARYQWAKPLVLPGDPSYPFTSSKEGDDYGSFGFKQSLFYKTPEQIKAEESESR